MDKPKEIYNGIELRVLQTLVPVNALSLDHLDALLRDQYVETLFAGQTVFSQGEYDGCHVYLLSGEIALSSSTQKSVLDAADPECLYPLAHQQPRSCGAIAKTDCSIIRFNSDQLDGMLAWDQASDYIILDLSARRDLDEDADWMLELLKSNLFYKVPPMNIRSILDKFEASYRSSGETIIRQGELGDGCYFIKEGSVGVYRATSDRSASELVAELGVGRCFGEDALVNDAARNATIVMHSNGVLMKLNKQDFFLLLKSPNVKSLSLSEARLQLEPGTRWIDVRTQDEFERGHSDNALNMPLNLLKLKSRMLDRNDQIFVYCNSGRRSAAAAHFLGEEGFRVTLLDGGIENYADRAEYFSFT